MRTATKKREERLKLYETGQDSIKKYIDKQPTQFLIADHLLNLLGSSTDWEHRLYDFKDLTLELIPILADPAVAERTHWGIDSIKSQLKLLHIFFEELYYDKVARAEIQYHALEYLDLENFEEKLEFDQIVAEHS